MGVVLLQQRTTTTPPPPSHAYSERGSAEAKEQRREGGEGPKNELENPEQREGRGGVRGNE